MARDHHRLNTDIWGEHSIRKLTRLQQQAYLLVLSQADLSRCGVLAYRPRRWAKTSADGTEKHLRRDYDALTKTRHVVIDDDTEELFARTYVRHDHILAQPNMVAALVSDYQLIASDTICLAFLTELRRLWDLPDLPAGERAGWLLAMGQYPATAAPGEKGEWPHTMTPAAVARIGKAIKTGLRPQMLSAIEAGKVQGFTEASTEGIPAGFTEASTEPFAEPPGEHVRAHGPLAPTPSPSPTPASGGAALAPLTEPHAAQQLIAEWIDHSPKRPPAAVIGQIGKQLNTLLSEGQDPDDLRTALAAWATKGLHPSTLPSVVHEITTAGLRTDTRPSASAAAAQAALDAGARVAARRAQESA